MSSCNASLTHGVPSVDQNNIGFGPSSQQCSHEPVCMYTLLMAQAILTTEISYISLFKQWMTNTTQTSHDSMTTYRSQQFCHVVINGLCQIHNNHPNISQSFSKKDQYYWFTKLDFSRHNIWMSSCNASLTHGVPSVDQNNIGFGPSSQQCSHEPVCMYTLLMAQAILTTEISYISLFKQWMTNTTQTSHDSMTTYRSQQFCHVVINGLCQIHNNHPNISQSFSKKDQYYWFTKLDYFQA